MAKVSDLIQNTEAAKEAATRAAAQVVDDQAKLTDDQKAADAAKATSDAQATKLTDVIARNGVVTNGGSIYQVIGGILHVDKPVDAATLDYDDPDAAPDNGGEPGGITPAPAPQVDENGNPIVQ